ncbi:MAG: DUF1573 domain-containing protein, partial [Acidobacteria bacterium]|nr:DUF1573 domain-containing protein [Acidobacteriota bacterium]
STYLGGQGIDLGHAVTRDSGGNLFVTGFTQSRDFPLTPGALRRSTGFGTNTAFIARIGDERPAPGSLRVISGNNQVVDQNTRTAEALVVELRDTFNNPMPGMTVTFAPGSTNVTVAGVQAITDLQGRAQTFATAGIRPGAAIVRAAHGNLRPTEFMLTVRRIGPVPPEITTGGVTGAGGSIPPVRVVSPLGLAVLNGVSLAPDGFSAEGTPDQNGILPLSIGGTCVTVGTVAARLLSVNDRQIRFQVPDLPVNTTQPVQVISNCGEHGELRSDPESVQVLATAPEFLFWQENPDGRNPVLAVKIAGGTPTGPPGLPGLPLTAAAPEDAISVLALGLGRTSPTFGAGEAPSSRAPSVEPVTVLLDDREIPPQDVLYVGAAPGRVGTYLVEFRVPRDVRNGSLNLTLRTGERQSPPGAFLRVAGGLDLNPRIAVSPLRIDLGEVVAATTREFQLTVANTGTAPLNVTGFTTGHPAVTVAPSIGFRVPPGDSRIVTVRFNNTPLGAFSTDIRIGSDDPERPSVSVPFAATVVQQLAVLNPLPVLQNLSPSVVDAGSVGFNLVVNGSGFVRSSVVELNGRPINTFFNHQGQLISFIAANEISQPAGIRVTVSSPPPGGGRSAQQLLTVRGATAAAGPSVAVHQFDLQFCPLVNSYMTVFDAANVPITGLQAVSCTEDAAPVACRLVPAVNETPLSISILYGLNGTANEEERQILRNAVRQFVLSLRANDRIQLIHLDDFREQAVFGDTRENVLAKIDLLRPIPGANLLLDSAWFALNSVGRERGRRQAVFLFTGMENRGGGLQDYNQLIGTVRSAGVPFFTYALGAGAGDNVDLAAVLRQLARDSNGQYTVEADARNYATRFQALNRILDSQYQIEFRATTIDSTAKTMRFTFSLPDGQVTGTRTYTPCFSAGLLGAGGTQR